MGGRDGLNGRDGWDGKNGERGEKGEKGERGERGERGEKGERGERGEKGERGEDGKIILQDCCPKKICKSCNKSEDCSSFVIDFLSKKMQCGQQECKLIYKIANVSVIILYGFILDECRECSPCPLFLRNSSCKNYKNGLGCYDDCKNEINNRHCIQMDLGDYIRSKQWKCPPPIIHISGLKQFEQILIFGSNTYGELGILIYTYTNDSCENKMHEMSMPSFNTSNTTRTGDLYKFGTLPFRFISISCSNETIVLHSLTFFI